jgi:hypothetical protein
MSAPLSDRRRVEFMLPPLLMEALIAGMGARFVRAAAEGEDPAETEMAQDQSAVLLALFAAAVDQAVEDVLPRKRAALIRRAKREAVAVCAALDHAPAVKIAMVVYYLLCDIGPLGFAIVEGSPLHQAMERLVPLLGHGFAESRRDASAQKQAEKLLRRLQDRGWYRTSGTSAIYAGELAAGGRA